MQKIIYCRHLIMLIVVQTGSCKVAFKSELFKVTQHLRLDWNFILSYNKSLTVLDRLICCFVPGMLFDLSCRYSLVWVSFHHAVQDVFAFGR